MEGIFPWCYILLVTWEVAYTDEFGDGWAELSEERQLRTQRHGRPFRTLYAFDPRRNAILLIGGDKSGNDRWYEVHVPLPDRLYEDHLRQLREEGFSGDEKILSIARQAVPRCCGTCAG